MKITSILMGLILLANFNSFAQDSTKPKDSGLQPKGYYSIKPRYTNPGIVKVSENDQPAKKGYYSIKGNEGKLPAQMRWYYLPASRVEQKGFYSIPPKKRPGRVW